MAFIKRAVLRTDSGAASEGEGGSQPSQQQQSSESLSAVSADVSDLMAPEKRKTLLFEPSVVSQSMIDFYVTKGYFAEGVCRPPGAELIPVPETGEVVVFKDFFTAGLRLPMDPIVPKLLEPFNVKLHHFTPNGIVALAKFLWVVRSFGGEVSVDAFCRLFQLHCQPRKVYVDDDSELSEVQNGCCTFVPRKPNKKDRSVKGYALNSLQEQVGGELVRILVLRQDWLP